MWHPRPGTSLIIENICLALPETTRAHQLGSQCFRAGKKNFCTLHFRAKRLRLSVWAGVENQDIASFDERYSVPPYTGHNGWLDGDIHEVLIDRECQLRLASYRHFALKRMLKAPDLDEAQHLRWGRALVVIRVREFWGVENGRTAG